MSIVRQFGLASVVRWSFPDGFRASQASSGPALGAFFQLNSLTYGNQAVVSRLDTVTRLASNDSGTTCACSGILG